MASGICLGALGNVFNSTFCDHCPKILDSSLGVTECNRKKGKERKQETTLHLFGCLRLTTKQANVEKIIGGLSKDNDCNYNYISCVILVISVVIPIHKY